MAELKRTYTIPLRRGYANTPRHRRTHKAVRVMKEFLTKHMKSDEIKIGKHLNEHLWQNGIRNPPAKVKVIANKDAQGIVRVELEGKNYVDFKLQDKTESNQTFKEKMQQKVAEVKGDKDSKQDATEQPAEEKPAKTQSSKTTSAQKTTSSSESTEEKKAPAKTAAKKEETVSNKNVASAQKTEEPSSEVENKAEEKPKAQEAEKKSE